VKTLILSWGDLPIDTRRGRNPTATGGRVFFLGCPLLRRLNPEHLEGFEVSPLDRRGFLRSF